MKNNLKRIAIILPVIALLLAFLAVPAAADYSPDTGWDAPVGTFEPFEMPVMVGVDTSIGDYIYNNIPIGIPFEKDGESIELRYKIDIDTTVIPSVVGDLPLYDGLFIVHFMQGDLGINIACDSIKISSDSGGRFSVSVSPIFNDSYMNIAFYMTDELDLYFIEYPLTVDDYQGWEMLTFEAYEAESTSPTEPIGNVWTGIMTWITSALTSVMGAFYVDGSLTLLGTLSCIGVSVGIGFLLIGLIQRFLKLRG